MPVSTTAAAAEVAVKEPSILLVCAMGIGIVFLGLIAIILVCKLTSLLCRTGKSAAPIPAAVPAVEKKSDVIENRGAFIAAVSAAVAEDLGADVRAIRIVSVKRV